MSIDICERASRKIIYDPACRHRMMIKQQAFQLNLEHSVKKTALCLEF
jgi:hypothetical protein